MITILHTTDSLSVGCRKPVGQVVPGHYLGMVPNFTGAFLEYDGSIHATGTAHPIEHYIAEYEKGLSRDGDAG